MENFTQTSENQTVMNPETFKFNRTILSSDQKDRINDLIIAAKRAGATEEIKNKLFGIHDGIFYAELFNLIDGPSRSILMDLYTELAPSKQKYYDQLADMYHLPYLDAASAFMTIQSNLSDLQHEIECGILNQQQQIEKLNNIKTFISNCNTIEHCANLNVLDHIKFRK